MSAADVNLPNPPGVDPTESRVGTLIGWSVVMMLLSGTAVWLRFVARYLVQRQNRKDAIHLEDWLAVAALPFGWMMCCIAMWGAAHDNFGLHIGASTLTTLHRFLVGLFVFEHAYNFNLALTKLSMVVLLWRIFAVRSSHLYLAVACIFVFLWILGATFTLIISCYPISAFWDLTLPRNCIDDSHYWIGAAVPNILVDVVLLVLPTFWIMKLQISKPQKAGLCFIFLLGIFVTVCSSLRLWQLVIYSETSSHQKVADATWGLATTATWSLVEGNLSIVCCCLPSMRPLLRFLVHGKVSYGHDYSRTRNASSKRGSMPPPGRDFRRLSSPVPLIPIARPRSPETSTAPRDAAGTRPLSPNPAPGRIKGRAAGFVHPSYGSQAGTHHSARAQGSSLASPASQQSWLRMSSGSPTENSNPRSVSEPRHPEIEPDWPGVVAEKGPRTISFASTAPASPNTAASPCEFHRPSSMFGPFSTYTSASALKNAPGHAQGYGEV